jgi:hypothetical protein
LSLAANGADGVTVTMGNEGGVCAAKFDGKDDPEKGTMWPAGWTCVLAKNGERAIDLTWKKDGKDMYKSTITAAASGKVLTESGSAAGVSEKYSIVYDKQ